LEESEDSLSEFSMTAVLDWDDAGNIITGEPNGSFLISFEYEIEN